MSALVVRYRTAEENEDDDYRDVQQRLSRLALRISPLVEININTLGMKFNDRDLIFDRVREKLSMISINYDEYVVSSDNLADSEPLDLDGLAEYIFVLQSKPPNYNFTDKLVIYGYKNGVKVTPLISEFLEAWSPSRLRLLKLKLL